MLYKVCIGVKKSSLPTQRWPNQSWGPFSLKSAIDRSPIWQECQMTQDPSAKAIWPARTYIQQLCADTGCSLEDLPEAMDDRERWQERVREIRADGTTWWWWYIYIHTHTHIYIYIYIYTHTQIYIHTLQFFFVFFYFIYHW